jgi:hypothetical protein
MDAMFHDRPQVDADATRDDGQALASALQSFWDYPACCATACKQGA